MCARAVHGASAVTYIANSKHSLFGVVQDVLLVQMGRGKFRVCAATVLVALVVGLSTVSLLQRLRPAAMSLKCGKQGG